MKYLLFRPDYGFAVYNPDDGRVSYTQNVEGGCEAEKADWSDALGAALVEHVFVPARIGVTELEYQLTAAHRRIEELEAENLRLTGLIDCAMLD